MNWKEVGEHAENIGIGLRELDLIPPVYAEKQDWRFIGIQSKNRKEWNLLHLANMQQGVTTVAFYDTLGEAAQLFMMNQTELTTLAITADYVEKIAKMKIKDAKEGNLMKRVKNLIIFEDEG